MRKIQRNLESAMMLKKVLHSEMSHMRKSCLRTLKGVLFVIVLSATIATRVSAMTFGFSSYSKAEGFVYDNSDNSLVHVQVSYFDGWNLCRTFTDSTGHFELKLKMFDGAGFSKIRSEDQIEIARKYMNSAFLIPFPPFVWVGKKSEELIGRNLYEREVSLSFKRLGMDSVEINTSIYCRMRDVDLKLNSIGVIYMRPSDNYDSFRNVDSKSYFTNKIIYDDTHSSWVFYGDSRVSISSDDGFELLKHIDQDYLSHDLLALGERARLHSRLGFYSVLAGFGIGLGGAIFAEGSERISLITFGVVTMFSGVYLHQKAEKKKREFIYQYNRDLDKRFLSGSQN